MPTCPICGHAHTGDRCPRCDAETGNAQWLLRFIHRETILLAVLLAITAAAFMLTRAAAQSNREMRLRDAATWHELAERELRAGRMDAATGALRRAVVTDPDSVPYQLALARALAANQQYDEARQVLLRVREREPEGADVNLELARVGARGGDPAATVRYYELALAALWSDEHNEARQGVRMELIEFLLRQNQRSRALSELLVISAALPDDAATRTVIGRLFLEVGDPRRALEQFTSALRSDREHAPALAGAGEASFELGDYVRARQYLARAPASIEGVDDLRTITELVLTRDPLAPRLGTAERRRRLAANLDHAAQRLAECEASAGDQGRAAPPDLGGLSEELETIRSAVRRGRRQVDRDDAESGLDLIARIVRVAGEACGSPQPLDRALLLIARRHDIGL